MVNRLLASLSLLPVLCSFYSFDSCWAQDPAAYFAFRTWKRRALRLIELPTEDWKLLERERGALDKEAIRRIYDFANKFKAKDYLADSRELALYALPASSVSVDDPSKERLREMIKWRHFTSQISAP